MIPDKTPGANEPDRLSWYLGGVWLYFFTGGIQGVIYPWIITVKLNESSAMVGVAQMLSMLPLLLLGLFGGAKADRTELRSHIMRLQIFAMLPPLVLAGLILHGTLNYVIMICYALTLSAIGGFVMPARDSMLSRIAFQNPRNNIQKVVALAMSGQFLAQVAGLCLGGQVMHIGAPVLLVVQSLVMGCAAFATSKLEPAHPTPREGPRRSQLRDVWEGIEAVWQSERIRPVLIMMMLSGILFMGVFMVLFPILIRDLYHGSSFALALVNMCFFGGIGISSYTLSRLRPIRRQGRAIMLAMCTGSTVMIAIHFHPPLWGIDLLALMWGLSAGVSMSQARAVVQESAPDHLRARVLAAFSLGTLGGGPIGSLLMGYIIGWVGPLNAVLVPSSLMILLWISIFFLTPLWRMEMPKRRIG